MNVTISDTGNAIYLVTHREAVAMNIALPGERHDWATRVTAEMFHRKVVIEGVTTKKNRGIHNMGFTAYVRTRPVLAGWDR